MFKMKVKGWFVVKEDKPQIMKIAVNTEEKTKKYIQLVAFKKEVREQLKKHDKTVAKFFCDNAYSYNDETFLVISEVLFGE